MGVVLTDLQIIGHDPNTAYLEDEVHYSGLAVSSGAYVRCVFYVMNGGNAVEVSVVNHGWVANGGGFGSVKQFSQTELAIIQANMGDSRTATIKIVASGYKDASYTQKDGQDAGITFTMKSPLPEITSISVSPYNASKVAEAFGSDVFVQRLSAVKVDFAASGKGGARIVSSYLEVDGIRYTGGYEGPITTSYVLTSSGDVKVTLGVVDSRGATATASSTVSVYSYDNPMVVPYPGSADIECYRCGNTGNASSEGQYVRIKARVRYSSVGGKNKRVLRYRIKPDGAGYTTWRQLIGDTETSDAVDRYFLEYLGENMAYTVQIGVVDNYTESGYVTRELPSAAAWSHEKKNALALGGLSKKEKTFQCYWDAEFLGGVNLGWKTSNLNLQPIYGSEWRYLKQTDGTFVMFGTFAIKVNADKELVLPPVPTDFAIDTYVPSVLIGGNGVWVDGFREGSSREYIIHVASFNTIPVQTEFKVHVVIYGTWK